MKKLLLLITVLFISTGSLVAQEDKLIDQDYVIMQDGEVVKYTKGMPATIKEAVTLKDGSVVLFKQMEVMFAVRIRNLT